MLGQVLLWPISLVAIAIHTWKLPHKLKVNWNIYRQTDRHTYIHKMDSKVPPAIIASNTRTHTPILTIKLFNASLACQKIVHHRAFVTNNTINHNKQLTSSPGTRSSGLGPDGLGTAVNRDSGVSGARNWLVWKTSSISESLYTHSAESGAANLQDDEEYLFNYTWIYCLQCLMSMI